MDLWIVVVGLIALAVVTVVGHAIWLMIAAICGIETSKTASRHCVFCDRETTSDRCGWCDKDLTTPLALELQDLQAVERQLQRFRKRGALKDDEIEGFRKRLQAYRRSVLSPAKAAEQPTLVKPIEEPAPKPAPVATPIKPPVVPPQAPKPAPVVTPKPVAEPKPTVAASPTWSPQAAKVAVPATAPRPAPYVPPAPPRRSWGEMLADLMEERNIRWGELIGGLLIVCSSIALVVSLWETFKQIPYFPFFIFVTVSSAIFGVGLYAHRRWRLESTSRGLLVIATLLVPLNFIAIAGLSKQQWNTTTLISELVSLGIFAWLVSMAAGVLAPRSRWLAALAVVGNSGAILVAARLIDSSSPLWAFLGIGVLPTVLCGIAVAGQILGSRRGDASTTKKLRLDASGAASLYTLLGTTAFSMFVALGFLVTQTVDVADIASVVAIFPQLSVLLTLSAMPGIAASLTVVRGVGRDAELGAYRLAGTTIAMIGMVTMLVALGFAWPEPRWLIAVGLLNATALFVAAFRWRLPAMHAGVVACITIVYLTAFHWIFGNLASVDHSELGRAMLEATVSARSGTALVGLLLIFAAVSEILSRAGFLRHGMIYAGGCVAVAAAGLLLVTFYGATQGGNDALRAAVLYAIYGVSSAVIAARLRRIEVAYLGLAMIAASPFWALRWHEATHDIGPLWAAVLAGEGLAMAVAAAVLGRFSFSVWLDPWRWIFVGDSKERRAGLLPSASGSKASASPIVDLYRAPLAHLAELLTMLGLAATVVFAWRDLDIWVEQIEPIIASGCIAAVYFLLAWLYRSPGRTGIGSLVVVAASVYTFNFNYESLITEPWIISLLLPVTLGVAAAVFLQWWADCQESGDLAERVKKIFGQPLAHASLLASMLVVPAMLPSLAELGNEGSLVLQAGLTLWLAMVWLVLAWRSTSEGLFIAHQTALMVSVVLAAMAFVGVQPWQFEGLGYEAFEPRSLQVYGAALGLLSLFWIGVRLALQSLETEAGPMLDRWRQLVCRSWTVDRLARHAIVMAQLVMLVMFVWNEQFCELMPSLATTPTIAAFNAFGPTGWLLLAVLVGVLAAAIWQQWQEAEMCSSILLAVTAACLVAGHFMPDIAVASALRWSLAVAFLVCSVVVWQRVQVLDWCRTIGGRIELTGNPSQIARGLIVATTVLPVVGLTIFAAAAQISGVRPAGPRADTFFAQLGPTWSYVIPLALLMIGLIGYAIRERSAAHAFSAGLVLELMVTLGYALHTSLVGNRFEVPFTVTLLQLATIAAGAWAILWLIALRVARRFNAAQADRPTVAPLLDLQVAIALLGNLVLIGLAIADIAFAPHFVWQSWAVMAGLPLGWVAIALPLVALRLRGPLHPTLVGVFGMAIIALLASTVAGLYPYWQLLVEPLNAYRTLMLGWAIYALMIVVATWWVASRQSQQDAEGSPYAWSHMAATWVRVAGMLAVLLGLKAAFWHDDPQEKLWAAAAIAIASAAVATMAVWRRREGWAFTAALGVNLAASLVVWHFELIAGLSFDQWWLRLVQANVIASAVVALMWLAARRRLYELRELTVRQSPYLAQQIAMPAFGTLLLLIVPVAWLFHSPGWLPSWMFDLATWPGWLGLVLTALAAAWYLRGTAPESQFHALGGLAFGASVLAACGVAVVQAWEGEGLWLSYHMLTVAFGTAATVLLAIGMAGRRLQKTTRFARPLVQGWVTLLGGLAVMLAISHGFDDPMRPWWSVRTILAMVVGSGLIAMWLRKSAYVDLSGILINVSGILVWWAWTSPGLPIGQWSGASIHSLIQTNVLCLAIGSILWTLVRPLHPDGVPRPNFGGSSQPFAHLAVQLGTTILAVFVVVAVGIELFAGHTNIGRLDWIAVGALAVAAALCVFERARFVLPALYVQGLSALALGLIARDFSPKMFYWTAVNELAFFALGMAIIGWCLAKVKQAFESETLAYNTSWRGWFPWAQAVAVGLVAALAAWIAIDPAFNGCQRTIIGISIAGRWAAAPAAFKILVVALVMTGTRTGTWRAVWQYAAMGLLALFFSVIGWAALDVNLLEPWLHRCATLMIAAGVVSLTARFVLGRILPSASDWIERGRQTFPALGGVAIAMLVSILAREEFLFTQRLPAIVRPWAIGAVIVVLIGLAVACIVMAVMPASRKEGGDRTERQRQAFVYAAEALVLVLCLHLKITVPELFKSDLMKWYWMLFMVVIAFIGAGLSEWFRRREMPVLSVPLERTAFFLPLASAIGFWFMPEQDTIWTLVGRVPAVWFFMSLFYSTIAVLRRSVAATAMAILAANVGLWVMLHQCEIGFLRHPQLWLIPMALAALVAEYLNRSRLSEAQSSAFRYVALSVIYVSSTAEMYIIGLGQDWRLPVVLMVLAVGGALAGILLRVRSFLYLGISFLFVDVLSMIWYAAVDCDKTWIWYATGIVLGIAIIALFAVFEKRRNDIVAAVKKLKEWER